MLLCRKIIRICTFDERTVQTKFSLHCLLFPFSQIVSQIHILKNVFVKMFNFQKNITHSVSKIQIHIFYTGPVLAKENIFQFSNFVYFFNIIYDFILNIFGNIYFKQRKKRKMKIYLNLYRTLSMI